KPVQSLYTGAARGALSGMSAACATPPITTPARMVVARRTFVIHKPLMFWSGHFIRFDGIAARLRAAVKYIGQSKMLSQLSNTSKKLTLKSVKSLMVSYG